MESNIEDEVDKKVGEVIKEKDTALSSIHGVKVLLDEKLDKIDQLKAAASKRKQEFEDLQA